MYNPDRTIGNVPHTSSPPANTLVTTESQNNEKVTVHEKSIMICFYCKKEYKVSTIWNHLVRECKQNPRRSTEEKEEEQKKDNLRAKLFARAHKDEIALRSDYRTFNKNEPFPKRDFWTGRIFHLFCPESPFYLSYSKKTNRFPDVCYFNDQIIRDVVFKDHCKYHYVDMFLMLLHFINNC